MSTELVLPGQVTATSLRLPETFTFEQWCEIGDTLASAVEGVQWWLSDWWAFGQHHYGERARWALEQEQWAFKTLRNAGSVARAFAETSRRRDALSYSHHVEVAALPPTEADELLDRAEAERWSVMTLRTAVRQRQSAERLGLAAAEAPALAAMGRFQVIYADPPWRYEHARPREAVENHYPTMELEEICALEVPAADDSIVFLWATGPKDREAHAVLDAWGFDYRTQMVWFKPSIGMGYYVRVQHELLLIARRGDLPVPAEDTRPPSVVEAPRGEHSEKPALFYDLIETMYPGLAYVELFARTARPGWVAWGNQVPAAGA